jgi:hypothetical protein
MVLLAFMVLFADSDPLMLPEGEENELDSADAVDSVAGTESVDTVETLIDNPKLLVDGIIEGVAPRDDDDSPLPTTKLEMMDVAAPPKLDVEDEALGACERSLEDGCKFKMVVEDN